jgi:bacillithiol system protein YtxJ
MQFMENHFKRIASKEALDELMARSNKEPVAVFKHSTACPVSASAYRELEDFPGEVALIEVQGSRALSTEIEARTGVPHESPQVIILRNGKAVWHASHWKVTSHAVEQALREHV